MTEIGQRDPWHATALGKAMLALMPTEDQSHALLERVGTPRINHNTLVSILAQIDAYGGAVAERGYALDREESEEDLTCFASAIAGPDGSPLFALSVSFVSFRVDQDDYEGGRRRRPRRRRRAPHLASASTGHENE